MPRHLYFLCLSMMLLLGTEMPASAQTLASVQLQSSSTNATTDPNQITLKSLLDQLESTFSVRFNYRAGLVRSAKVATRPLEYFNSGMTKQLNRLLAPLEMLCVEIDSQTFVIREKRPLQKNSAVREESPGTHITGDDESLVSPTDETPDAVPDRSISGRVTDAVSGEGLPGVSILLKGTQKGAITDAEGNFNVAIPDEEAVLMFSFVGYLSQEVMVGNRTSLQVTLQVDEKTLEELVVVGYGTVKKADMTGAVSQVKAEEITNYPVFSVDQALKGRASGVRVTQNSGRPGGRVEVQIRGGNSMMGSNEPLYVVDGFPITGNIDFLNPADITAIDILKDASATAIYGARGANGVVMVTTKAGKTGQQNRLEIGSYFGVQTIAKRYDMLNASEYATVVNEWLKNSNQPAYFDLNTITDEGTDWQDVIYRTASIQNHNLSFSGSSEKTQFMISGNYFKQDGIIFNSGIKKAGINSRINHQHNNWLKVSTSVNLSRIDDSFMPVDNSAHGSTVLSGALAAPPTLPLYDETGKYTRVNQIYSFGSESMNNPLIYSDPYKNIRSRNTMLTNSSLEIKIKPDLIFKSLIGFEYEIGSRETFTPIIYTGDRGGASSTNSIRNSTLNENTLTYSKTFNEKHSLELLGGFTYQFTRNRSTGISVSGFLNNSTEDYNLSAAEIVNPPSSDISEWTLASWLGRVNYSLLGKYLLTASIRTDGSSRFGINNKWGTFPSAAFAWRVSEEKFMSDVYFIDDFKIRTSFGMTGNTSVAPYQSLNRLSSVRYIYENQNQAIGYVPSGIANSSLKWETTAQLDLGFDLSVLKNRVHVTFDFYSKNTYDLLASVPLPPSMGFSSTLRNIGKMRNQGFELGISADILTKEFRWNIGSQIFTNRNKVIELANASDVRGGSINILGNVNLARQGQPFGVFYGYKENGLDEAGNIKYVDLNGDNLINTSDLTIIGDPYPDLVYSLNSNMSYKNFELSLFFEGTKGNDIFWATSATHLNSFQRGSNQFSDLIGNYWTPENPNPNAKYPRVSPSTQFSVSDRYIKDGSYIRLKSLRIAYNIPGVSIGKSSILSRSQLYLSATNLLTFTRYPGLDPEVNSTGSDSQSISSRLSMGVDESAYPTSRMFTGGIVINF